MFGEQYLKRQRVVHIAGISLELANVRLDALDGRIHRCNRAVTTNTELTKQTLHTLDHLAFKQHQK